jgi:hypothetical protein
MFVRKLLPAILVALMVSVSPSAVAQDATSSAKQADNSAKREESSAKQPEKPAATYRLDFSINELENGKKINARRYLQTVTTQPEFDRSFRELKIGSRVPVEVGNGQFQYIDIGTNISSRLYPRADELMLDAKAEISNVAAPSEDAKSLHPIVRQMVIGGSMALTPGKPLVIGSVDDPSSTHTFQLEVTATKL